MLNAGEDELVCDFAETYHILDLRALPVPLAATLAWGLRPAQTSGAAGVHGDTDVGGRGGPSLSAAVAEDGERAEEPEPTGYAYG